MSFLLRALETSMVSNSMLAVIVLVLRLFFSSARARYAVAMVGLAAMVVVPVYGAITHLSSPHLVASPQTPLYAILWGVGVLAITLSRLGFGAWQLRSIIAESLPFQGPEVDLAIKRLAASLGLHRLPDVRQIASVWSPCTIGILKPVILIPAAILAQLSPAQLEAILAHELAHIRRFDYWLNLLQLAIESLLFYHPGTWLISHFARVERELCCDDLALQVTGDAQTYARALAAVAGFRHGSLAPAATVSVAYRMRRVLGLRCARSFSPVASLGLCLAILPGLVAFSHSRPVVRFPMASLPKTWRAEARIPPGTELIEIRFDASGENARIVLTQPPVGDKTWFTLDKLRFEGTKNQDGDIVFVRTDQA